MRVLYIVIASAVTLLPLNAKQLTIDEAIKIALQNNQMQKISQQDRLIAEAKYKQALSANFPTLEINLFANRRDQNFIDEVNDSIDINLDPTNAINGAYTKAYTDALSAGATQAEAQAAGATAAATVGNTLSILAPAFETMDISYTHTVMGRDTVSAKAEVKYPLYTGGKITALQEQAKAGVEYAKENSKLKSDEIAYNVKKYFNALVLASELKSLMQDTVDRMQSIFDLTNTFYKGGSLKVKKTDFLRTKLMLLNMKSMLESFKSASILAKSALKFEMGISQKESIEIDKSSLKLHRLDSSLSKYFESMYLHNHQYKFLDIGLKAKEAKIKEVRSDYFPTVALYANASTLHNNRDGGIINTQNDDSWNIGIAAHWSIFNGGLTKQKTMEARAERLKLQIQKSYLKSGLKVKAKSAYVQAKSSFKEMKIMKDAVMTAKESSNLNFRAYQEEMVDTKDVVEAQFMQSITEAGYYKARYETAINEAKLEYIIGKNLK